MNIDHIHLGKDVSVPLLRMQKNGRQFSCPGRMFVEEVPVVWDETKVLSESTIGKLAALARRKKRYLSILNGGKEHNQDIVLDFLPKGKYKIKSAIDDRTNRKKIKVETQIVKNNQKINIKLFSGDGYIAKIEKIKK